MKVNNRYVLVVLMALVLLCPVWTYAKDKPADNMKLVIEKVRADKKLFIAANMQLTDKEAKKFWPLYDKYQNELFLLRSRTMQLISDYAKAYKNMTDKTAKRLLEECMAIEEARLKLQKSYVPKFRKVLSDIKTVRYFQLENKINAALMYQLAAKIPLIKDAQK